jgi:hypothetical protein
MLHADLDRLARDPYVVGAKFDGVRYLLLLTKYPRELGGQEVAVMINRRWDMYPLFVSARRQHYVQGSLFDGELTMVHLPDTYGMDTLGCSGTDWGIPGSVSPGSEPLGRGLQDHPRPGSAGRVRQAYFVFDAVTIRGEPVGRTHVYTQRWAMLKDLFFCGNEDVDMLRFPKEWRTTLANKIAASDSSPYGRIVSQGNPHFLSFFTKQWFPLHAIETLQRCGAQAQAPSDGIIFMPLMEAVGVRRQESLLKWKETHTIDLVVPAAGSPSQALMYYDGPERGNVGDPIQARDGLDVRLLCVALPQDASGCVCEFKLESVQALPALPPLVPGQAATEASYILLLSFVCARTDKEHPNDARTVRATIENFMHPVTKEQIIAACKQNVHRVDVGSANEPGGTGGRRHRVSDL